MWKNIFHYKNIYLCSLHVSRCAGLYFRKVVKIKLVAALLGHSADICRSTYIHFAEEQKKTAAGLIDDYEIKWTK